MCCKALRNRVYRWHQLSNIFGNRVMISQPVDNIFFLLWSVVITKIKSCLGTLQMKAQSRTCIKRKNEKKTLHDWFEQLHKWITTPSLAEGLRAIPLATCRDFYSMLGNASECFTRVVATKCFTLVATRVRFPRRFKSVSNYTDQIDIAKPNNSLRLAYARWVDSCSRPRAQRIDR